MKRILAFFCLGAALFALIGQGLVWVDNTRLHVRESFSRIERDGAKTELKLPEPNLVFLGHSVRAEEGSVLRVTDRGVELMGVGGWYPESDGATLLRRMVWWVMFAACLGAGLYLLRDVRRERREALAAKAGENPKIRLVQAPSAGQRGNGANGA